MKPSEAIAIVRSRLAAAADPDRADAEKRYLHSPVAHYGVAVPALRSLARELTPGRSTTRATLWPLVDALWDAPSHEEKSVAVHLLERNARVLLPEDLERLRQMIARAYTWAHVDLLAVHVVGAVVEQHPAAAGQLDAWIADAAMWVRRAALLALLKPLRAGRGDWPRFARYATQCLEEHEFFMRKAIGWVLRERSRTHPDQVAAFVAENRARISPLTWREATRNLPAELRSRLEKLPAHGKR